MLPIINLNNLMEFNPTLFDGIMIPSDCDGQALIDLIMLNYGEMQFLYPDWTSAKIFINSWFRAHYTSIQNLWKDYNASYNPLYNKDAYFTEERTPDLTDTRTPDLQDERTANLTNELTHGKKSTESGSRETQYKGFDSSTYQDVNKEIPAAVLTNSGKDTVKDTGTDTYRHTGTESTTHTGTEKIVRREYGNIGVTTSTQLIQSDSEFWQIYNWYDIIAKMFACDFCVMVY